MKQRWITLGLCLLIAILLFVRLRPRGMSNARPHGESNTAAQAPNVYLGLRDLVLQGARDNFGLAPGTRPTQPFAIVIDQGSEDGTTTIVAVADGSASVYSSRAAGQMGGGQAHESIRRAAMKTVEEAGQVLPLMRPATDYPIAQPRQMTFYAVTDAGVFAATALADDVRGHHSPFSGLADAAQLIVTEYAANPRKQ